MAQTTSSSARRDTPDAVGRGSLGPEHDAPSTLFVLAGSSLGATLIEGEGTPQWYDLRRVVALDAIGEVEGAKLRIEVALDDGQSFEAVWPEPFCDKVVARLRELLETGSMSPRGESDTGSAPSVAERAAPGEPIEATSTPSLPAPPSPPAPSTPAAPAPSPAPTASPGPAASAFTPPTPPADQPDTDPVVVLPGASPFGPSPAPGATPTGPGTDAAETPGIAASPAPSPPPAPAAPAAGPGAVPDPPLPPLPPPVGGIGEPMLPGDGPPLATSGVDGGRELVLNDVVYHSGYPGETKRRKKCTAVLGAAGLRVQGPSGPDFTVDWSLVRTIEAQNADEAKFRLNIRPKRASTTLVVECEQGVTIVVEARDVPTLPLRAAVSELVSGRDVVVA